MRLAVKALQITEAEMKNVLSRLNATAAPMQSIPAEVSVSSLCL